MYSRKTFNRLPRKLLIRCVYQAEIAIIGLNFTASGVGTLMYRFGFDIQVLVIISLPWNWGRL